MFMYRSKVNGITLVSLVITIIILLILAMVSISLVINSGIINKAKYGVDKYSEEEELEQIKLAVSSARLKGNGFLTTENLNSELQAYFNNNKTADDKTNYYIYKASKNYIIYKDGKVEEYRALYIKDGLILWYDGICNIVNNDKPTINQWEDLTGNNHNGIISGDVHYDEEEKNGYICEGKNTLSNYIKNEDAEIMFNYSNSFTFQLVLKRLNWGSGIGNVFFGNSPNGDGINESWGAPNDSQLCVRFLGVRFPDYGYYDFCTSKPFVITGAYNSENHTIYIYLNSTLIKQANAYNCNSTGIILNGRSGSGYSGKNKFYSVRYYNKYLNNDEVIQNIKIDKELFNF